MMFSLIRDPLELLLIGRLGRNSKRRIKLQVMEIKQEIVLLWLRGPTQQVAEAEIYFKDKTLYWPFCCCRGKYKANTRSTDLRAVRNTENSDKLCQCELTGGI